MNFKVTHFILFSDIIEHSVFFLVRQFADNVVPCVCNWSLQNQCIVNISLPSMEVDKTSLAYSCNNCFGVFSDLNYKCAS